MAPQQTPPPPLPPPLSVERGGGERGACHVCRVARNGAVASAPLSVIESGYKKPSPVGCSPGTAAYVEPPLLLLLHVDSESSEQSGRETRRVITHRIKAHFRASVDFQAFPHPQQPTLPTPPLSLALFWKSQRGFPFSSAAFVRTRAFLRLLRLSD